MTTVFDIHWNETKTGANKTNYNFLSHPKRRNKVGHGSFSICCLCKKTKMPSSSSIIENNPRNFVMSNPVTRQDISKNLRRFSKIFLRIIKEKHGVKIITYVDKKDYLFFKALHGCF